MRSTAARIGAAGLILAAAVATAGVAGADPTPEPPPAPTSVEAAPPPGPAPSQAPATSPSAAPSATPAGAPKTTMDKDGTYAVGTDIAPGIYSSPGPVGTGTCYWKRTANPDGALIDNNLSKKPQVVRIEPTDKTFKTNGCQPWQNTPDAQVPDIPGPAAGAQLQNQLGTLNGLLGPNGLRVPGT